MASGSSGIMEGLGSSLTGNVNKAYILFHKPVREGAKPEGNETREGLKKLASALKTAADSAGAGTGFSSVFGADKNLASQSNKANYIPVRVQYNPSSLSFSGTSGGTKTEENTGGKERRSYITYKSPAVTTMRVDLIFDDTRNADAFMMESSLLSASNLVQGGIRGVGQAIKEKSADGLFHTEYSVQDISELFIAAMPDQYSRYVGFVWNKMIFWGELTSADVEFTMFNRSGNPIRSRVSLTIEQENQGAKQTEADWSASFKELFKEN